MSVQLVQYRREVWVADMASPPSDETLAGRLQAGDPGALRLLMERYQRPLYGYLTRMLGSTQDAEDVFQETFLRVLRAIARFDTTRRFRPWLYAIATNLVRNTYRSRGYRDALTLDGAEEEGSLASRLAGPAPRPSESLENEDRARIVGDAVAALPEKGRTALVLYYYQGLSYEEVSQTLEIPLGTVKSRIHNAMVRLDKALARREEEVR